MSTTAEVPVLEAPPAKKALEPTEVADKIYRACESVEVVQVLVAES
jgi:hypothetical protein